MQKNKQASFFDRVYEVVKTVPKGKVITYGLIAEIIGTKDARRVGQALHANKDGQGVPCHRVVNKEGGLAPSYAFGGIEKQKQILIDEGVEFLDDVHVNLKKCIMNYEA